MNKNPRPFLTSLFQAAVQSAQPSIAVPRSLPSPPKGRTIVIGAGKASAAMAQALEKHWEGPLSGLVVTRYGYAVECADIEILEAAHPVPDAAGEVAAKRILQIVQGLTEDDLVICLISGGGSALLPLPLPGLTLADKQTVNQALLKSGATITEMNCVRRHLSSIKGGRLAAACYPARLVNLMISDVPGDNPSDIASGPTVADSSTTSEAFEILQRYELALPQHIISALNSSQSESIKPNDPQLPDIETHIIATPKLALQAAADEAIKAGVTPVILGDSIEGEARDVGKVLAGIALSQATDRFLCANPCVLLSGGETTVSVRGTGRGGRNVEFLLSFALAMKGKGGVFALAGDTDGVDGLEDIAGAYCAPDTIDRAWSKGLNAQDYLSNNDGHSFFESLGDSIITGPTMTNVNDFRAIYIP